MIHASGASRLELGEFSVNNARISMSGASICKINVNGRIDVDLSGGSTVNHTGQPALGQIKLSGGSTINNDAGD